MKCEAKPVSDNLLISLSHLGILKCGFSSTKMNEAANFTFFPPVIWLQSSSEANIPLHSETYCSKNTKDTIIGTDAPTFCC